MYCEYFYPSVPHYCPMMNMYYPARSCNCDYNYNYEYEREMPRNNYDKEEQFQIKFKKVSIEELQD